MVFPSRCLRAFFSHESRHLTKAHFARACPWSRPIDHTHTSIGRSVTTRLSHNSSPLQATPVLAESPDPNFEVAPAPNLAKSPGQALPLPIVCPGCGALSQEIQSGEAGYYSRSRRAVRSFVKAIREQDKERSEQRERVEDDEAKPALNDALEDVKVSATTPTAVTNITTLPVCDRCHDLVHNSRGESIAHPSVEDLADTIAESPYDRNHIYHVLDAADFPMSLIPAVFSKLSLARPRSQNRRAQYDHSRKPTVSFIVTRSDLLGPTKDMVDGMMPYFRSVLRSALGRTGQNMRLGEVHLVSAKRGWWTKEIKESIWKRGGGNWLLGKFNVGKSNLFEVLFPKGSGERAPVYAELREKVEQVGTGDVSEQSDNILSESSLLPPVQPETPFPTFPLVSSLPGTTASPIRLSFGGRRGELIDLPGLRRGEIEEFVQPEHKLDLVMTHRPNVSQHVIKPGQSLVLGGGLIRITPLLDQHDPNTTVLAYPFVPIDAHVTSTEKAALIQQQLRESGVKTIVADNVGAGMSSAGILALDADVTRERSGPLLRAGIPAARLPFRVYSTDVLVESVGWVELVCQVRRRRIQGEVKAPDSSITIEELPNWTPLSGDGSAVSDTTTDTSHDPNIPRVEIFSPRGKYVSQRKPLGAWQMWDDGRKRRSRPVSSRPRPSMKGTKKREKEKGATIGPST